MSFDCDDVSAVIFCGSADYSGDHWLHDTGNPRANCVILRVDLHDADSAFAAAGTLIVFGMLTLTVTVLDIGTARQPTAIRWGYQGSQGT